MPKLKEKLPKYSHLNGMGFYWLNAKRVYLPGKFSSPESLAAYHEAMSSLSQDRTETSNAQQLQTANRKANQLSVKELVDMFFDWGKTHYLKNGKPSETIKDFDKSCKVLLDLYGRITVDDFSQRELITVQEILVSNGLARKTVNDYLRRQKRIFNWAAGRGIISHEIAGRLKFVESLKAGRTVAPEMPKRKPVDDAIVDATLPHLPPVVRDMVVVQRITGCRPGEIFSMTWAQIDMSDDIWIYMPSHKTQHLSGQCH